MKAYSFDNEGFFIEEVEIEDLYGPIPENILFTAPPELTGTQVARRLGNSWEVLEARPEPEPEQETTPQEMTTEEKINLFIVLIQKRLDDFAKSEGRIYDSMLSACTYAVSVNPVYSAEGLYCVNARDETWQTAYSILNDVMTGKRPEPTWEEFEAELPKLEWPKL